MEILYPVSTESPRDDAPAPGSITVLVDREVPVAQEKVFLATLTGLLESFGRFPGTSGSLVFRREAKDIGITVDAEEVKKEIRRLLEEKDMVYGTTKYYEWAQKEFGEDAGRVRI